MAGLWLGEVVDPATHARTGVRVSVPAGDLTTHGVIVGMTGSGKTGLGVVLVEEALSAGVGCLVIDPKGDLASLALRFADLSAEEFAPWVGAGGASGAAVPPEAVAEAAMWRDGLASWGLGPTDVAALAAAGEVTVYTPGATYGAPLDLIGSLSVPAGADPESRRDDAGTVVSALLGLVGVESDPLAGREHVLLVNLVEAAWSQGRDLDLAALTALVVDPPVRRLGVFDVEAFYPRPERMALALRFNALLASPSFAAWGAGAPADPAALTRSPDGRPRVAVVNLSHLDDAERQFAVTVLLGRVVSWMRAVGGAGGLRLLVYFDEVAGYVPPTAAPPAKRPLLTLAKQARAFGVGLVLATQNPVDVDYKVLSNAGTWMIGRLQTERDRDRLLEGMRSAAGGVDIGAVASTLSGLAKREFVLRRAGRDQPEVFTTRWAMSYLRGPLSRQEVRRLVAPAPAATPVTVAAVTVAPGPDGDTTPVAPPVAPGVDVAHLDPAAPWAGEVGALAGGTRLVPVVVARARLTYDDTAARLRHTEEHRLVVHPLGADPSTAFAVDADDRDLRPAPPGGAAYVLPVEPVADKAWWARLRRGLVDHLVATRTTVVWRNATLRMWSRAGEGAEAFAARCDAVADDRADEEAAGLRTKYATRAARLRRALDDAEGRAERAGAAAESARAADVVGVVGGLLDSLLGGRRRARSLGHAAERAVRSRHRADDARARADAAAERVDAARADLAELEADLAADLARITRRWDEAAAAVEAVEVPLERNDVDVTSLALVWVPTAPAAAPR